MNSSRPRRSRRSARISDETSPSATFAITSRRARLPVGGTPPRRRFDRFGSGAGGRFGKPPIDDLARPRRPLPRRVEDQVGRDERSGLASDDITNALDDRPQRDDRGDADRDADEKEQEAVPRRPRLPHGHSKDESHGRTGRLLSVKGRARSAPTRSDADSTTRPSRSASRASANDASSASCVTSTTVLPR